MPATARESGLNKPELVHKIGVLKHLIHFTQALPYLAMRYGLNPLATRSGPSTSTGGKVVEVQWEPGFEALSYNALCKRYNVGVGDTLAISGIPSIGGKRSDYNQTIFHGERNSYSITSTPNKMYSQKDIDDSTNWPT